MIDDIFKASTLLLWKLSLNFAIALFLVLFIAPSVSLQTVLCAPKNKTVTVGVALPLTGPIAWVGQSMRKGIELAVNDAKKADPATTYQIAYEDDLSSNRQTAVTIFKKFTSALQVDGIINCSTSTLSAIAPIISQSKTPTVILWDSNRNMPKLSDAAIGFGYSNEKAAEEAAEFLVNTLGKKRIAVIYYVNDWSELLTRSFLAHAAKLGATITIQEQVDGATTDYRSLLVRAKQMKSDALYLPLFGPGLTSALKQSKDLRLDSAILTVDSLGEEELVDAGIAAEGVFVSQIAIQNQEFAKKLEDAFPGSSQSSVFTGYSALGYDGMNFLLSQLAKNSSASKDEALNHFRGISYQGILGTTSISAEGIADRSIPILKVKNGKFEPRDAQL